MPELHHQIVIAAQARAIFPLIASAEGFQRWWAADARNAAGANGMIELSAFDPAVVCRLRPQTFMAPKQTSWHCESGGEWAGTTISFVVGPVGEGSLLRLTHNSWRTESDLYNRCNTIWGALLFRLRGAAEGQERGPLISREGLGY